MDNAIRVFIVDDHYMVIEGIRQLLQHEKTVELIGHATTAEACMAFLKLQQPDVILMDINLPDRNGIDVCREVKDLYPSIFILGLSTFDQQSFIQKMIENGASGYVLKNASGEKLVEAIHTVSRGKMFMSSELSQILKHKPEKEIAVTRREKDVLMLIAEGMTNQQIAQQLRIGITTVDTHRKNLIEKFSARNTAELVALAFQKNVLKK
jgi:DNA-binding NarL/FixJ family response regulator